MPGNQHKSWLSATFRLQFPEISHCAPLEFLRGAVQVSPLESLKEKGISGRPSDSWGDLCECDAMGMRVGQLVGC